MDVIAWVPGIPGDGPKFPVPVNFQPGTLCLKYKGMKIFIPCKSTKIQSDSNIAKDVKEKKNNVNDKFKSSKSPTQIRYKSADSEYTVGEVWSYSEGQKFSAVPLKRSVGVQWNVDDTEGTSKLINPLQTSNRTFDYIENKKLTADTKKSNRFNKDIKVKKFQVPAVVNHYNTIMKKPVNSFDNNVNNVSVISDIRKELGGGDREGLNLIEKEKLNFKHGTVRRLIKLFENTNAASANK
ncbi:uncharacterized protein LOC112689691 [Sipha flava]|uniref:Uncharacterized protein LOC112689691 n=1 Tax=Sipha flava TaxID=143950 RepID=A0A8B8G8W7_9HEMI|nr:uncharacterized protein LOC112689691 [Sipha flava]